MWRAAISVLLAASFGACLIWSIVAVITQGHVVAAVACMSASLVGSFGMLVCHLSRAAPAPSPAVRRIEVIAARRFARGESESASDKGVRSPRARQVVVSETAVLCVAVECDARASPNAGSSACSSPGLMIWAFEPTISRVEWS